MRACLVAGRSRAEGPACGVASGTEGVSRPIPASGDPSLPAVVPIEDSIDLHTFRPNETASVVAAYVAEARDRGFREVRIIHGRGKGVQRRIVRSVLERHPLVRAYEDAPPGRGGWGATIAWLETDAPRRTDTGDH